MKLSIAVLLCIVVSGCASLEGQKFGTRERAGSVGGAGESVAPTGIPFTLTKPVYTLSRSVPGTAGAPVVYSIGVAYEPDPRHRYSLRQDTVPFTDPDFLVQLSEDGTLTATKSVTNETITPAIKALGSFVTNLIGARGLGVYDDGGGLGKIVLYLIQSEASKPDGPAACKVDADSPFNRYQASATRSVPKTITEQIADQIQMYSTSEEFQARWHYLTQGELACLQGIIEKQGNVLADDAKNGKEKWEAERTSYLKSSAPDSAWVERLDGPVKAGDEEEVNRIIGDLNIEELEKAPDGRARARLFNVAKLVAKASAGAVAKAQIDAIVDMAAPTWRWRHVQYLEQQLETVNLFRLRNPAVAQERRRASALASWEMALERELALTMDAAPHYARLRALSEFLSTIPIKTGSGGRAPATAEYATARQEFDLLNAFLADRRARIKEKGTPTAAPGPEPLNNVRIAEATLDVIAKSKERDWISTDAGKAAPQFVLVLEEAK